MHRAWISACLKMDFRIWLVLRCLGEGAREAVKTRPAIISGSKNQDWKETELCQIKRQNY